MNLEHTAGQVPYLLEERLTASVFHKSIVKKNKEKKGCNINVSVCNWVNSIYSEVFTWTCSYVCWNLSF